MLIIDLLYPSRYKYEGSAIDNNNILEFILFWIEPCGVITGPVAGKFAAKAGFRIGPYKDAFFVFWVSKKGKNIPAYKMDMVKNVCQGIFFNRFGVFKGIGQRAVSEKPGWELFILC